MKLVKEVRLSSQLNINELSEVLIELLTRMISSFTFNICRNIYPKINNLLFTKYGTVIDPISLGQGRPYRWVVNHVQYYSLKGIEGAAANAQVKQLEQQNSRLKEAIMRYYLICYLK